MIGGWEPAIEWFALLREAKVFKCFVAEATEVTHVSGLSPIVKKRILSPQ